MSKQEFLDNVRIARNLFSHPHVLADSSAIDPQTVQHAIARAAIWLTPKSVNGFDPADFSELSPARQNELSTAIDDFTNIARQVPANKPATEDQRVKAQDAFRRLLDILAPYLPTPQDGDKIERALQGVRFPAWVVNWDYEIGSDADDAPAVWVNLYVDDTAPRPEFGKMASRMTTTIRDALTANGSSRWPYVRVRTAVEHKTP